MRIIHEIVECEIGYLTVHERRARILAYIRGKGVAFKDVKSFLEKEAVKEGKVNNPAEIETARANKLTWVIYLDRYVRWIEETFKAGWVEKKKPEKKSTKKETPSGVVAIPKSLSKKRAEKLVENPDTRKSIEEAFPSLIASFSKKDLTSLKATPLPRIYAKILARFSWMVR